MKKSAKKKRILRWHGILFDAKRLIRVVTIIVLAVLSAALAFTDLGFVGIGREGDYLAYAVAMLLPVSLASLLLGTLWGTLIGLFSGGVLYLHAIFLPLDYYEFSFVNSVTSIVMLSVAGFMLGCMFAFALRNDPSKIKRVIYILIVCFLMSWLYSVGFFFNVILLTAANLIENLSNSGASYEYIEETSRLAAVTLASRMGDMQIQILTDGLIMSLACIVADFLGRMAVARANNMGLRSKFAACLSASVFVVYLITIGAGFVSISLGEISDAKYQMEGEISYLSNQLDNADNRLESLIDLFVDIGLYDMEISEKQSNAIMQAISIDTLLDGYTKEKDGTIVILYDSSTGEEDASESSDAGYYVVVSDNERFSKAGKLDEVIDSSIADAVTQSLKSKSLERVVYDEVQITSFEQLENSDRSIHSHIAYVYAVQASDYIIMMMYPASKVFAGRSVVMLWTALSAFILLLTVFGMVFLLLDRLIVKRIDETNGVLSEITHGDLDVRVDIRDSREFASLSGGINNTVSALKGWIEEAETRMDAELATAKEIQESALPRTFPPYPDIIKFDIYASMNAAKKVGGDFYDFFLIGDDSDADARKLGFVVADVSGKGVPAALFMMKAKTQIRDYLTSGMELGEAIENANRQLCDGNDAGMFVTAWVGVLDYATGHIEYVNAGHNPPLLWQSEHGWQWLTEKSGLPLGLFDEFPYQAFSVECTTGDELLIYTDGVTEAMDVDGELYGEERLKKFADENFTLHPRRLIEALRQSVAKHAMGAEQSDDITMLALEVGVPPEVTATLIVPADVDELPRVNEFIHTELDRRLCPLRVQHQLDIAVEELFVNVAHYAYKDTGDDKPHVARVSYTYSADPPSIVVDIADEGVEYNPLAKPDAVTPDDIMDVPIGGLGILMAKRSVDEMRYERIDGSNVVTIVKRW